MSKRVYNVTRQVTVNIVIIECKEKTQETQELVEGFASGQMLDSPHHPTGTTEKIDGIGE